MSISEDVIISIIIPTFNRAGRLRTCLESLSKQTQTPSSFEVVVVIDGSTDETDAMLAALHTPYHLRVIRQENQGQCAALNRGAEAARGTFCLFLDDDIIAVPELVARHLQAQAQWDGVIGIGQIRITLPPGADWYARCFALGWQRQYERLNRGEHVPSWVDCYGGNMSVPRSAYLAVNGNSLDLRRSYDVELAYRLQHLGLSFTYIAEALGIQDERKGRRELAADSEEAGAASVELFQRHPAMLSQLFGSFDAGSRRKKLLRRILFALHIPPWFLVAVGWPLTHTALACRCFSFIQNYCYWRGVQRQLPDKDAWNHLTQTI